jgi:hypothetical protein
MLYIVIFNWGFLCGQDLSQEVAMVAIPKLAAARSVMRQHHLPSTARQGTTRPQLSEMWVSLQCLYVDSKLCSKPFEPTTKASVQVDVWSTGIVFFELFLVSRTVIYAVPKCPVISTSNIAG